MVRKSLKSYIVIDINALVAEDCSKEYILNRNCLFENREQRQIEDVQLDIAIRGGQ